MRIVLLSNPRSGRGTGAEIAASLADRLERAGHEVARLLAGRELDPTLLRAALASSELLVVAGGDGTLHHALPAIIESRIRFYHFPLGTENLFTREFGMTANPETLVRAIVAGRERVCDAGVCNGRVFSLMVSIGFDACVVERVAAARSAGVTRGAYVRQAVQELMNPRIPRCTVHVDGQTVIESKQGLLVIANSRQYAARLDPARRADMSDGLLDVVFYPHSTAVGLARWLLATAAGLHMEARGLVTARGKHIRVVLDAPAPHQIDGEACGHASMLPGTGAGLHASVLPGALRVLTP